MRKTNLFLIFFLFVFALPFTVATLVYVERSDHGATLAAEAEEGHPTVIPTEIQPSEKPTPTIFSIPEDK